MNIHQAYTSWASNYDSDRNLTRDLDQTITQETLANLHCSSILEIGCGTAKNTTFLTGISQHVCAIDFSIGMLTKAQARLHDMNVILVLADLTNPWPCAAQWADLIVCNLILEHIENLDLIFAEASRVLRLGGHFFISELHPFRQYQGKKAIFQQAQRSVEIPAFVHHISEFLKVAEQNDLDIQDMKEWWHADDQNDLPRLVSFMFRRPT
jgi:ubiquinone/menaquinone biosynthesis C-methylase UbiE